MPTSTTIFDNIPINTKFKALYCGQTYRFRKKDDNAVFRYAYGKSRYGWQMDKDSFCRNCDIDMKSLPEYEWRKNVNTIVHKLTNSGLWPEILDLFKNLQQMSYTDYKEIGHRYTNIRYNGTTNNVHAVFSDLIAKYPFIIKDGDIDTNYCYNEIADAKLKSMYFGSYNKNIKNQIKDALQSKTKFSTRERVNYDVSYQYDPDKNKAWYSEEYKGCGNGHYYIALDENTALFCEND